MNFDRIKGSLRLIILPVEVPHLVQFMLLNAIIN